MWCANQLSDRDARRQATGTATYSSFRRFAVKTTETFYTPQER
jgi:hypothetical protein